jgi:phenylpropionate dioxygenase-like ring-hydroxylating dioxygenase large terminal subunit
MLSKDDNELLTRTGPDTPMGKLMRRYWLPAIFSDDLREADGPQVRIRILGEDLIAFRDSSGAVGLLGAHCPHRGVSLYFGRNEGYGLRCPYHGWKFDVTGRCVDMPNEVPGSRLQENLRHTAYPCVERGGLIWTYMGGGAPPPLPNFEWLDLPQTHRHLSMRVQECNWLQALEGEIDSSHAPILHGRVDGRGHGPDTLIGMNDKHPRFEVIETDGGVQIGARRDAGDDYYWRVNQFLMPFWTIVPPGGGGEPDINGHAWVPIDDEHTLCVMYSYHPDRAISERRLKLFNEGARGREPGHMTVNGALPFDPTKPYGKYWPKWNRSNDYGLDWEVHRSRYFLGTAGLWPQDGACQESMGLVSNRTQEHLCSSDIGIGRVRRLLRSAVTALRDSGEAPASVHDPDVYRVRAICIVLPKEVPWLEGIAPHLTASGPIAYEIPGPNSSS